MGWLTGQVRRWRAGVVRPNWGSVQRKLALSACYLCHFQRPGPLLMALRPQDNKAPLRQRNCLDSPHTGTSLHLE